MQLISSIICLQQLILNHDWNTLLCRRSPYVLHQNFHTYTNPREFSFLLADLEDHSTRHQLPTTLAWYHLHGYNADSSDDEIWERRHQRPVQHLTTTRSQDYPSEIRSVRTGNSSTSRHSRLSGRSPAANFFRHDDLTTLESEYDDYYDH